jgi:hypothetical protein
VESGERPLARIARESLGDDDDYGTGHQHEQNPPDRDAVYPEGLREEVVEEILTEMDEFQQHRSTGCGNQADPDCVDERLEGKPLGG